MLTRSVSQAVLGAVVIFLPALHLGAAERARTNALRTSTNASLDSESLVSQTRASMVIIKQHGRGAQSEAIGSGFVVSREGLIATCLHVIDEARRISVELADGRQLEATEVHASDRKLDLAVIRVAATNLTPLRLGDSDSLNQGAPVVAIGNPLGLRHSVVQGIVSARREVEGVQMIQVAIPIERGNSGGPLIDSRGRVHGVLSMKSAVTENLGFAIPANHLKKLLDAPNPVSIERWLNIVSLNPAEWTPLMGARWRRKDGGIYVEGAGDGFGGRSICVSREQVPARPYELSVTVKLDEEAGAAGLIFEADGGDRHYGFYPTAGQLRLTRFEGPSVFSWTILDDAPTPHYRHGDWNTIKVRAETNRLLCYVNGQLVIESADAELRGGQVGLAKFRNTRAQFRDFQLGTNVTDAAAARGELTAGLREEIASLAADASDAKLNLEFKNSGNESGPAFLSSKFSRSLLLAEARDLELRAGRVRALAAQLHARTVETEIVAALNHSEERIDLLHAALLVARLDNPELHIEPYRKEVGRMAEELRARLVAKATDSNRLAALTKFLFSENGFHGSRTDYYNRANSYLNDVIDDREGLPITLSVLYLELARRIGVSDVSGVPVPTRFMVKHAPRDERERIIDVFDGGKLLTRTEAIELIAENVDAVSDDAFKAATRREIIVRMLRNLLGIAQRNGAHGDALRYLSVIIALVPDSAADRLSRARTHMQAGDNARAKQDLRWLLDREVPGLDLERIAELYRSL